MSFWNDQLQDRENAFVINGEHYRTGTATKPSRSNGMSGDFHRIKTFTGQVIDTVDLWHQGTVPETYRGVLQDTAKFVRMISVSEYKQCPNCKDLMNRDTCYKTTCNGITLTNEERIEVKNV